MYFFQPSAYLMCRPNACIEPLRAALLEHALAIGRVADDEALVRRQAHLRRVSLAELDELRNARLARVLARDVERGRVDVRAENVIVPAELAIASLPFWPDVQTSAGTQRHFSAAKLRCRPGARLSAMSAASMQIVPEPQNGSQKKSRPR